MSKATIIAWLMEMMLKQVSPEQLKRWADMALDMIEDSIEGDGVDDWRDKVVLPMCRLARDAFGIEDK